MSTYSQSPSIIVDPVSHNSVTIDKDCQPARRGHDRAQNALLPDRLTAFLSSLSTKLRLAAVQILGVLAQSVFPRRLKLPLLYLFEMDGREQELLDESMFGVLDGKAGEEAENAKGLEEEDDVKERFLLDLEFVQALANIEYLARASSLLL